MRPTTWLAAFAFALAAAAACKKKEAEPVEVESAQPDKPSAPAGDVEVRFVLSIDGATHEVTGDPIKLDGGAELNVAERPTRRYRDERFSFDYPSRIRVGATPEAVTAADGATMAKLMVMPRAEVDETRAAAIADLQRMTGGSLAETTRTIAGKPVAGKAVVTTGADRKKEIYWIPLDDKDALLIELLHPLGADLDDIGKLLASIAPGPSEPRPDFDLMAGGAAVAELQLDTPVKVELPGGAGEVAISRRPMVRRRIGRLSFEHPPSAAVARQNNPLGSGVQIGLDNVAVSAMVISGTPAELKSALLGQGTPLGPVEAKIGGGSHKGTSLLMFGGTMTAELYTIPHAGQTFMVMVQYSPSVAGARETAAPLLASLRAN
jgi:hypothetical protein